jgi:hypothetical protein
MGGGFLALVIGAVLLVVPFWKLLPRYGISQYVAILAVIPVVALILLWIIAFKDDFEGSGE